MLCGSICLLGFNVCVILKSPMTMKLLNATNAGSKSTRQSTRHTGFYGVSSWPCDELTGFQRRHWVIFRWAVNIQTSTSTSTMSDLRAPVDLFFEVSKDGRTCGHTLKSANHRTDKDLRHNFFSERIVQRWNQLDKDAVEATSLNSFKNCLAKLRNKKMGFFMDLSPQSPLAGSSHIPGHIPGAAAPSEALDPAKGLCRLKSTKKPIFLLRNFVISIWNMVYILFGKSRCKTCIKFFSHLQKTDNSPSLYINEWTNFHLNFTFAPGKCKHRLFLSFLMFCANLQTSSWHFWYQSLLFWQLPHKCFNWCSRSSYMNIKMHSAHIIHAFVH